MFLKAIMLGIVTWLTGNWACQLTGWAVTASPLITATITGFILGDPLYGMQIGAVVALAYMGNITTGGVPASDSSYVGYIGTALTMLTHSKPEVGVTIAVSLGFIGLLAVNVKMTLNSIWVHRADEAAKRGDTRAIYLNNLVYPHIIGILVYGVPAFLAVYFGESYFKMFMDALPEFLLTGFEAVGTVLPCIGLALLIKAIFNKSFFPFFFIGYVLAAYMKLDVIAITVLGISIAVLYLTMKAKRGGNADEYSS